MKDAPIIILDEATACVDPENETELTEAIEALTREKAIIMIAHRLKTVRRADQIFVVDNGRIVQRGIHREMIAKDGIYKTFVEGRQEAASWKIAYHKNRTSPVNASFSAAFLFPESAGPPARHRPRRWLP